MISFFLASALVGAVGDVSSMQSDHIAFQDNAATLSGSVHVEHPLGTLQAEKMTLQHQTRRILMDGGVFIALKQGGEVRAKQADVDYEKKEAVFTGDVFFTRPLNGRTITARTETATVAFASDNTVSLLTIPSTLSITIPEVLQLHSASAAYNTMPVSAATLKEVTGTIAKDPEHPIAFKAATATWQGNTLYLSGDMEFSNEEFGTLTSDGTALFAFDSGDGGLHLHGITLEKRTTYHYIDPRTAGERYLVNEGIVYLDNTAHTLTISAPPGEQVYYRDHIGELYADIITVAYSAEDMRPEAITIQDNITFLNRVGEEVFQYGLADKVVIDPKTQTVVMSAPARGRVLFVDNLNKIRMSAPALALRHDNGSTSVKGVGSVRFSFLEQELEQIKQHFGNIADWKE
ncbi:MAG: hypothetical protein H7A37_01420 [Chlamydiales bacterium]|nr:hypothetical protein [Chlamydiia bacterium]MCP5506954.1 hypothetical protein [Chlamydiales bacterium]